MGKVFAIEPFIASSDVGPVVISDKTAYDDDAEIVTRFPDKFATPDELRDRGEGRDVSGIKSTNAGTRGRSK